MYRGAIFHSLFTGRGSITPSLQYLHISHVGGERGDVLGLLALRGHDVVAPATAVDAVDAAVPPEGGVASHRSGVVLGGSTLIIFLTTLKKRQSGNANVGLLLRESAHQF